MPGIYLTRRKPQRAGLYIVPKVAGKPLNTASIAAGGPGSGRRPYGTLKPTLSLDKAKTLTHPTWYRHFNWKHQAYGGVMVNEKGQFLLREPSGHFDGYVWTWPKGKMDDENEHPVDVAQREVAQETGYKGGIVGQLPYTYTSGSGSFSSFYVMRPTGYDKSQMDTETKRTKWVDYNEAKKLISQTHNTSGRQRDLTILEVAHNHLSKKKFSAAGEWNEALHPRDEKGEFAPNPSTGIVDKSAVIKGLQKLGWTKLPKMAPLPGLFHGQTIKSPKILLTHPQHGTIGLGSDMFYHMPKEGPQVKGNYQTELAKHVSQLQSQPKQTVPVPPTAKEVDEAITKLGVPLNPTPDPLSYAKIKEEHPEIFGPTTEKLQALPAGMSKMYVGIGQNSSTYHFNDKTGMYDEVGQSGKIYKDAFSPSEMKHGHDIGEVKPLGETSETAQPKTPPEGMASTYHGEWYSYHFNPGSTKYDVLWKGSGEYAHENLPASEVQHLLDNDLIKPGADQTPVSHIDEPPHPVNMAYQYKTSGGTIYTYNKDTGMYHSGGYDKVGVLPSNIKKIADQGTVTPVEKTPAEPVGGKEETRPSGMPASVKGPKGGVYTWDKNQQMYVHNKTGQYSLTKENVAYLMKQGKYTPYDPTAPGATKTGKLALASKVPQGMYSEYIKKGTTGYKTWHYKFDETTGNYQMWSGNKKWPSTVSPEHMLQKVQNWPAVQPKKGAVAGTGPAVTAKTTGSPTGATPVAAPTSSYKEPSPEVLKPASYKVEQPDQKGVEYKPPSTSTTMVPQGNAPSEDQLTFKGNGKALGIGGAHDKYIYTDKNGNEWMFKPATTLGGQPSPLMAHADEVTSRIAMALRPGYSVEAHAVTMNVPGQGKMLGSIQKMIPNNVLRGEGGKFKDFTGRNLDTHPLQPWEQAHLQQEQVLDWLISNHDSHEGQFLRTSGQYVGSRSVIGIDKSQAFKFLGNDKLSMDYHPNTMEKPPLYNQMWANVKAGKTNFDPNDSFETIKKAEGISDNDYKDILKPYADARFGTDTTAKDKFLDAAVARKNSLRSDFEKFYSGILGEKFVFEPVYDPNSKAVVNIKSGQKKEFLPDHEERPNRQAELQAAIPALMKQYAGTGKDGFDSGPLNAWEKAYYKSDPTLPEEQRWQLAAKGAGLYPELAAKVGLLPVDLQNVRNDIGEWKNTTSSSGAAHIRAAAQDVIAPGDKLKSRYSAAMQIEHEVTKQKLAQMYPGGTMLLYRGLTGEVASGLKASTKQAGMIEYHTMGAEGWSDNKSTGQGFGSGGVVLKADMPIGNVITSYKTSPGAMTSYLDEKESFVAFPGKVQMLQKHQIMGMVGILGMGVIMAANGKVVIDGTDQSHRAYPPDWKKKKKGPPPVVISVKITPKKP
ncbi:MAG: NUDIX domain-containing protein [Patescibacteria group bacterium]|nr:NUDIX domain-containing protein [Patescibacteria group bacterium]